MKAGTPSKRSRIEKPAMSPTSLRVEEFFEFVKTVVTERDSALSDAADLSSKMDDMTSDADRTAALERDVEYWRNDREVGFVLFKSFFFAERVCNLLLRRFRRLHGITMEWT